MRLLIFSIIGIIAISCSLPVFGEATYGVLNHRFVNQPIVCIYEPDVPKAREVIIDSWLREAESGIKNWEYELKATEILKSEKWNIEIQKIALENQPFFDNSDCDVEVKFVKTDPDATAAGWHFFDGVRSQISIVYTDKEVCSVRIEGNWRITEWCYKDDLIRSKALGNVASHEFGHAIGLKHYESDDPQENYDWSSDPYSSPSIMTLAVHYDEDRNKIRKIDIDKVKEIYGDAGFGEPKQKTTQNKIIDEKKLGGFESFYTLKQEYIKKRGIVDYVTISGKVSEEHYSRGQNVLINIEFPDGHNEEHKALTVGNREFSIQMILTDAIQTGIYTLNARYMGFDSQTISFRVIDSDSEDRKLDGTIPNWIRNNAKWWSDGSIKDRDFVIGMQYLAQERIIKIGKTTPESSSEIIPEWIRNNAKWWSDGLITDDDFIKGIEYLAQKGVIQVN